MTTLEPVPHTDESTNVRFLQTGRHDLHGPALERRPLAAWLAELLCSADCCALVHAEHGGEPAVLLLSARQLHEAVVASMGQPAPAPERAVAPMSSERRLLSLLFIDIVASTQTAERLGDAAWRTLLGRYRDIVRRQLARHGGQEVDNAGDGFFLRFETPTAAIRCAEAVRSASRTLGLDVHAGIHTGECESVAGHVSGVAVHVAARIAELAAPGEILVSATVRDLVAGSGLALRDRDWHVLKGLREPRQLFVLASQCAVQPAASN